MDILKLLGRKIDITPTQAFSLLAQSDFTIIDVREDWELELCKINEAMHIPMDEIPNSLDRIPKDHTLVIMCHGGVRSFSVAKYLQRNGFPKIYNLKGGIDRWAKDVDNTMKRY